MKRKFKFGDDWWTTPTESEDGKYQIIVTGRRGLEEAMESKEFNERIEVTWKYDALENGMPTLEDSLLMGKVNDAILAAFKKEQSAVVTGIYTGGGERNWIFYARNTAHFQYAFNKALSSFDVLPLSIYAEKDPDWAEYNEMKTLPKQPPLPTNIDYTYYK